MIDESVLDQDMLDTGILDYVEPEKDLHYNIRNVEQKDIIEAVKACLKVSDLIQPNKSLVNSVFAILTTLYLEDKKYAIIEAPTGSGKTIIGFMVYFCTQYLHYRCEQKDQLNSIAKPGEPLKNVAYFLTSAKMLQEQIDKDLDRFTFRDYISMVKGVDNYECIDATKKAKHMLAPGEKIKYSERSCIGMVKKDRQIIYSHCDNICSYQLARLEASEKSCTVLNYAYFLNVLKGEFNPFFAKRFLTIADEAHLIPDIVCNIFNYEFTQYIINRAFKILNEIEFTYGDKDMLDMKSSLMICFKVFNEPLNRLSEVMDYLNNLKIFYDKFIELEKVKPEVLNTHKITIYKLIESLKSILESIESINDLIINRPEDIYFESEEVAFEKITGAKVYKHIVKDLSEAEMVRKYFLTKVNKCVFMSATLGDVDEYAKMMGMAENEYGGLRLPSSFNFETSPVYLCRSGWLNYANFENNIDKILMDTLKICESYHPNEKGIVHTSTFKICQLLQTKVNNKLVKSPDRYLFYKTAEEKENCVKLMMNSQIPYVIIGPSLYEGLDLKDDAGRFNILMKVPYSGLSDYVKKKMERFPFWYRRNVLEKITQAVGRTNRHVNDYSTTYLLDSSFDKIIYDTNQIIVDRLQFKTIR